MKWSRTANDHITQKASFGGIIMCWALSGAYILCEILFAYLNVSVQSLERNYIFKQTNKCAHLCWTGPAVGLVTAKLPSSCHCSSGTEYELLPSDIRNLKIGTIPLYPHKHFLQHCLSKKLKLSAGFNIRVAGIRQIFGDSVWNSAIFRTELKAARRPRIRMVSM